MSSSHGPVTIAAVDAGSNGIRAIVARASSATRIDVVQTERVAVRLGRGAFTLGAIPSEAIDEAVAAFSRFRGLFDQHGVERLRAVGTSALRNAHNGDLLLRRVDHEAGIEVEVIDGDEEARLTRRAIDHAFRERTLPNLVLDLGGGSLEVGIRRGQRWDGASLPIGTVRMLETFELDGPIDADGARLVARHATALLHSVAPASIGTPLTPAVACGGNAEALAQILGKVDETGMPTIELDDLGNALPELLEADVATRMERYDVRVDRAEVMAVAALVLATVGSELKLRRLLVPGVGVREGILLDLAEEVVPGALPPEQVLIAEGRSFAARLGHDVAHGEHVRQLARALFDQLGSLHGLPEDLAPVLELAALLHDIGEVIHRRGHHRHGEYIVRWARVPGLEGERRDMVAALVRTHRKSDPDPKKHEIFASLDPRDQEWTRRLAALLRLADACDTDRRQRVRSLRSEVEGDHVQLRLGVEGEAGPLAEQALRKADLFERVFGTKLRCQVE